MGVATALLLLDFFFNYLVLWPFEDARSAETQDSTSGEYEVGACWSERITSHYLCTSVRH